MDIAYADLQTVPGGGLPCQHQILSVLDVPTQTAYRHLPRPSLHGVEGLKQIVPYTRYCDLLELRSIT